MFGGPVSHNFFEVITLECLVLFIVQSFDFVLPLLIFVMTTNIEMGSLPARDSTTLAPSQYPLHEPPSYSTHRLSSTSIQSLDLIFDSPPPYASVPSMAKKFRNRRFRPVSQISQSSIDFQVTGACPHCLFRYLRKSLKSWIRI
jgi:hypothetical protein